MARNWKLGLAAVIAVAAIGGIGFSAFTSNAYVVGNVSSGSINLEWTPTGSAAVVVSASNDVCSATVTQSTLYVNVSGLAPGDTCTLPSSDGVYLTNTGSIPASVTYTVSDTNPGCFSAFNTLPGSTFTVDPGAMLPAGGIEVQVGLIPGVGNACAGQSDTITFTQPGVAGV